MEAPATRHTDKISVKRQSKGPLRYAYPEQGQAQLRYAYPEQGQAQGLHQKRPGLDQAVLRDRRRTRYSQPGHPRRRSGVIKHGRTNFSELQAELAAGRQDRLVFYACDLLYLDGLDLRRSPQIERKRVLKALLDGCEGPVLYSEHLVGVGQEMFEHAAKLNWEGIVSKNADAAYRSDRNEAWLKIKTSQRARFPIVGFVKDPTGVAALYLGKREGEDLVYMGKVGTGWSRTVSSQIRKQLNDVVTPNSKLTKAIKKPKATWVEPSFHAEVEFRDITSEGLLRDASFKGLSKGK
jgi:bifunctional non-homologous end joining protein LigD